MMKLKIQFWRLLINMWYVIFVKGGNEVKVCQTLNKKRIDAFIPMREKFHRNNGKISKVNQVLFPNYVFINTELDHVTFSEEFNKLKQSDNNLIKQLRHDLEGTPPLYDEEVRSLELLLGKDRMIEASIGFIENELVVVTEGPLMGFESQIVHINRHKKEAKVRLNLMGSSREVTVSLDILTKI